MAGVVWFEKYKLYIERAENWLRGGGEWHENYFQIGYARSCNAGCVASTCEDTKYQLFDGSGCFCACSLVNLVRFGGEVATLLDFSFGLVSVHTVLCQAH